METKPMYIDLFAGCGGLSLGLYYAGWKGLFAVEKNPDAFKTLKYNLIEKKGHFNWPAWLPIQNFDINHILESYKDNLSSLGGNVDLVAGGPPCQGFSMAGRRKENDTRNNLVNSYIDFIDLIKPKLLFFENVKGFTLKFKKNKETGKEYSTFVQENLGKSYFVKGCLVNFGDYGVPQKRTRFILIGVRRDLKGASQELVNSFFDNLEENRFSFLAEKNLTIHTNLGDSISDLLKQNGTCDSPDSKNYKAGIYSEVKNPYQALMRDGIKGNGIADSHRFPKHRPEIIEKFDAILKTCRKNKDIDLETRKRFSIKKHTIIPLDEKSKSPTITTLPDDYIHYIEPRILTVREYARIQSFPDWFQFQGKYTTGGHLRTQQVPRYSQIGNAIPPLFSEQGGLVLKRMILNDD